MKKTCFFIGPIGEEESEVRDWSDQILRHIVSPVTMELDYDDPKRSDMITRSGSITFEIMRRLADDDLVIADLTNGNPNVFYELAIRHILQKPVIHLIKFGERIPFDVHDIRVIQIRTDNLGAAEKARKELKSQILSIEADGETVIPHIQQMKQLRNIFESPKSEQEKTEIVNLLEQLDKIRQNISDVKSEIVDLSSLIIQDRYPPTTFEENKIKKAAMINKKSGVNK